MGALEEKIVERRRSGQAEQMKKFLLQGALSLRCCVIIKILEE